jgi:16S rRNA processing protein RimM
MDIGVILGVFGVKGEVKIQSLRDGPGRFRNLETLTIVKPSGEEVSFRVEEVRIHKNFALVKFEGVMNRTDAEALKRCYVRVPDGECTEMEKTQTQREKLQGLEVYTMAGDRLGILEEVILTGANDVYEVRDGKKTILLPAISDVIKCIDLESGRIIVELLPGLI